MDTLFTKIQAWSLQIILILIVIIAALIFRMSNGSVLGFGVATGLTCEQLYPAETSIPGGPLEYFVSGAISEENKFDCFWIPGNDGDEINIGFTAEAITDLDFYNPSETLTDDPYNFGHNYAVSSGDIKVIEWAIPMPSSYYETLSGGTGDYYFKVHQYGGFVENSRYSLEIIRAETPLLKDDMVTTMPEPISAPFDVSLYGYDYSNPSFVEHLYVSHNNDSYTGTYWYIGNDFNNYPVWLNPDCGESCYIYRHPVAFTMSGWVWVLQPSPPSTEWLANAYIDADWPWEMVPGGDNWGPDVEFVDILPSAAVAAAEVGSTGSSYAEPATDCLELEYNETYSGLITSSDHYDCYFFIGEDSDFITFEFDATSNLDLEVYNPFEILTPDINNYGPTAYANSYTLPYLNLMLEDGPGFYGLKVHNFGKEISLIEDTSYVLKVASDTETYTSDSDYSTSTTAIVACDTLAPPDYITGYIPETGLEEMVLEWTVPCSITDNPIVGYVIDSVKINNPFDPTWSYGPLTSVGVDNDQDQGVIGDGYFNYVLINDLEAGSAYEITVSSIDSTGMKSAPSYPLFLEAPISSPSKPGNVIASLINNKEIVISWNKSIEDGGSPINGYQVLLNASPNPSTSDDWSIAVDWVPSAESLLMSSSTAGYAPKAEDIDDYYEILFNVDSVVPFGSEYQFVVLAYNDAGFTTFSDPTNIIIAHNSDNMLSTPDGAYAEIIVDTFNINLEEYPSAPSALVGSTYKADAVRVVWGTTPLLDNESYVVYMYNGQNSMNNITGNPDWVFGSGSKKITTNELIIPRHFFARTAEDGKLNSDYSDGYEDWFFTIRLINSATGMESDESHPSNFITLRPEYRTFDMGYLTGGNISNTGWMAYSDQQDIWFFEGSEGEKIDLKINNNLSSFESLIALLYIYDKDQSAIYNLINNYGGYDLLDWSAPPNYELGITSINNYELPISGTYAVRVITSSHVKKDGYEIYLNKTPPIAPVTQTPIYIEYPSWMEYLEANQETYITWTSVPEAISYKVDIYNTNNPMSTIRWTKTVSTNQLKVLFSNLETGDYYVRVAYEYLDENNSLRLSEWSYPLMFSVGINLVP